MNIEMKVPGLEIKLEFAEKKQVDRLILAVMEHVNGGSFKNVYDVAQTYTKRDTPSKTKGYIEKEGIRTYSDGHETYKCGYSCSNCNHTGVRYIHLEDEYCKCHECDTKLATMASTPDSAHDENHFYFLAY